MSTKKKAAPKKAQKPAPKKKIDVTQDARLKLIEDSHSATLAALATVHGEPFAGLNSSFIA